MVLGHYSSWRHGNPLHALAVLSSAAPPDRRLEKTRLMQSSTGVLILVFLLPGSQQPTSKSTRNEAR